MAARCGTWPATTRWAGNINLGGVSTNLLAAMGGFPVINNWLPFVSVSPATTFTITGDFGGQDALVKIGGGTLELAGIISRGQDRNNRILEGTLLLNNEPGVQASRGRYFVGTDVPGAPAATLKLGGSDQIIDDRRVEVFASGLFDLNGNSEVIARRQPDICTWVPSNAGDVNIGTGGTLTLNGGHPSTHGRRRATRRAARSPAARWPCNCSATSAGRLPGASRSTTAPRAPT